MASGGTQPYRVVELPAAMDELRELRDKATDRGVAASLLDALVTIATKLRTDPVAAGEALFRLKKEGSWVYRIACNPVFVRYAVFEPERVVMILKFQAMPSSTLDG